LLAVVFYRFIKYLEYETANPGQDFDEQEEELFNRPANPTSASQVKRPNPAAELSLSKPASPVEQGPSTTDATAATAATEKTRGQDIV
jgi:hypothetical protein